MPTLLVIGYVWPEPTSSAAGLRMMQLLDFFHAQNFNITYATTARETTNMLDLESRGITVKKIRLNDPQFDEFLKQLKPHTVLFDRFMMEEQFGWRVDMICPGALKILDTEDLHFLRKARHEAFKAGTDARHYFMDSDLAKREIAAIYRCDLSLIISETEMQLLQTEFKLPENILFYLPFLLDPVSVEEQSKLPDFDKRMDFISIGNFLHEPNWNAVLYLKEKLWPQIRKKLPKARLQIYGAYPNQKVWNLHNEKENFIVNGWAESSAEVMRNARVCLAPIQFGAGLKGKLVEAMQNGTASVTTPTGAEGIHGDFEWNGEITTSNETFIQQAVNIYQDETLWKHKQMNGFKIINSRFGKEHHSERFYKKLFELQNEFHAHRKSNFTGNMLKFHLHKSTYYMSRFIEEKNRSKK